MNGLVVKICGIRSLDAALAAADAGADLVGFVFAPSRRRVTVDEAAVIVDSLRRARAAPPGCVGVFVNEEPDAVMGVAEAVGLDAVQLSGDEPPEVVAALRRPVIKALRLPIGTEPDTARQLADAYLALPAVRALLVEGHQPGTFGGTGTAADWTLAAALAGEYPVLLAGGLTPTNVERAVRAVRPLGVDVSSGVERDGVKDPAAIAAFVHAARHALGQDVTGTAPLVAGEPAKEQE